MIRTPQVAGAAVALATVAAVAGCGSGGTDSSEGARSLPAPATTSPSPSRSYPLSEAPRSIPSVRTHEAARGPGWRPAATSGVVIAGGSGGLADEGRLLAQELKIAYRGAVPARAGDVELALASGGGAAESYTLTVRGGRVRITGPDQAGVFYGTRTLKQSVRADGVMPEGVVRDRPDRPQRGLNLDIARKYYTPAWIEDRLREMADLKLNQLGLHFSDDQGFRIASTTHPEIVSKEHLSQAEVRRILALAERLHINVVPEIDSPGHLGAVLAHYPALQLRNAAGVPTRGAIDISQAASARLVDDLLREFAGLFPGPYWHLGGDEYQALLVRDPEASYPRLARLAVQQYGSGGRIQDLTTAWTNGRASAMEPFDRKLRVWNDGIFRGGAVRADPSLEVAYWTGKEIGARPPEEYLNDGRDVINYNDEYLYYVLGQPNAFRYPTGQRIYEQWTPFVLRGTTPVPQRYSKQILGGLFAVWGDFPNAQTQDQVARGIRMPLRAVSQKLWNPARPALSWSGFTALAEKVDAG
ncbi:glycoside hydrolase family 20 protein [Streptomyces sp. AK02-01A]|uniref:beta-N-acetylhexosaminidase n=1 Tax=Streptomyces sp. AK02-01A TaxID=3028648 RepID=UPI0029B1C93D|nr:glycoside hydrolase family 20 protein [Streptomyces sp. AK02-01A]MDX3852278.1 glycoside hydrolase family 20 protein [Streptomyces sp. AK02-01A]